AGRYAVGVPRPRPRPAPGQRGVRRRAHRLVRARPVQPTCHRRSDAGGGDRGRRRRPRPTADGAGVSPRKRAIQLTVAAVLAAAVVEGLSTGFARAALLRMSVGVIGAAGLWVALAALPPPEPRRRHVVEADEPNPADVEAERLQHIVARAPA